MFTKIRLYWKTAFDPAHLANGVHVRIIRLYVPVSFKETTEWSDPVNAIIDLGSPLTVLPKRIWQNMQNIQYLSGAVPLGGIGSGTVLARLAQIQLAFLSTQKEIVERTIKAYLAEDDSVPLLLGIEDLLTEARLVCDYPKSKAFLQL
jgi:hypothetical protein